MRESTIKEGQLYDMRCGLAIMRHYFLFLTNK